MAKSRFFAVALLPVFVFGCQTVPTPTAAKTPATAQTFQVWSEDPGRRLTPADFGLPEDKVVIADPVVTHLPDGGFRMYVRAGKRPPGTTDLYSAVSSDGLHWTVEPGIRCTQTFCRGSLPEVVALPSGGWRLFFNQGYAIGQPVQDSVITSAVTRDGLTLTPDPGFRVRGRDFGMQPGTQFDSPRVVRTQDGGWRMYLTDEPEAQGLGPSHVFSAHSQDLMSWIPDAGVRMEGLNRPFVVAKADGTYEAFAGNFGGMGNAPLRCVCIARLTSADGITWSSPTLTGIVGGDLVGYSMPDGRSRLLYDDGDIWPPEGTGLFSGQLLTTTWGVSIDRGPAVPGQFNGPTRVTLKFIGTGRAITVRVVDRSHQLVRDVPGLPITVKPPATVQFNLEQQEQIKADQLILVTDGTVVRFFESYGSALADCGNGILCQASSSTCGPGTGTPCGPPTNCGPGTGTPCAPTNCGPSLGTPCPPTNCGAGTGTPCPIPCGTGPNELPCSLVRNAPPCQTGQPVGPKGCIVTNQNGVQEYCPPKNNVDPAAVSDACKPFYQNGS